MVCSAKRELARKPAADDDGLSIPSMALEIMCAAIRCGRILSRLRADGDVVVGVVNLPMLGKLYTASRGGGAHSTVPAFIAPPKHPSTNLFYV